MSDRADLNPSPSISLESFLRLRSLVLGRTHLPTHPPDAAAARAELDYIDRSGDLAGVVRSWLGSDEFVKRWPGNATFERVQGAEAWAAIDRGPRPLVHLHVPKTAGTSLNAVLQGHFDPLEIFVQRPLRDFLALPLARMMSLRLVTGHFGRLPADVLRHRDPIVFSMVRDPYDYYPSLWRFLRKVDALDPAVSLRQWLADGGAMDNRQTYAIVFDPRDAPGFVASGEGRTRSATDAALRDDVEEALDQLSLVAPSESVAELYSELCAVADLEPATGAFPRLNTTEPEPLGDDERELIEAKTTIDRWLYDEVVRRWRGRHPSPAG